MAFPLKKITPRLLSLIVICTLVVPLRLGAQDLEPVFEVSLDEKTYDEKLVQIEEKTLEPSTLILKLADGSRFEFSPSNLSSEELKKFESLGASERESFLRNRELLIALAGKLLYSLKTPIGMMKKVGAKFSLGKNNEQKLARKKLLEKTNREVGAESVEKILREFEKELWEYAPFVSKINEVGTSIEAGIAGGGKLGRLGAFVVLGAGLSMNVDPKEKALVLEFFQDVEWAKTALPGYIGAEAFASLFGNASYNDWQEPLSVEKGAALSLPGLAGCITDKNARVGVAKGLGFGFPGAAILTSSIVRIPLIRVGVSPKWSTFVRVKVLGGGYLTHPLKICGRVLVESCSRLFNLLSSK